MNITIRNEFSALISISKKTQGKYKFVDIKMMHEIMFNEHNKSKDKINGVYILENKHLQEIQEILFRYYFEKFINIHINKKYSNTDLVLNDIPLFIQAIQRYNPKEFTFNTFLSSTLKNLKRKNKEDVINLGTVIPALKREVFDKHNKHFILNGENIPGEFLIEDEETLKQIDKYHSMMLSVTTSIDNPIGDEEEGSATLESILSSPDEDEDDFEVHTQSELTMFKYKPDIDFINEVYDGLIEQTVSSDQKNLRRRKEIFNAMINNKKLHEAVSFMDGDTKLLTDITASAFNDSMSEDLRYSDEGRNLKEKIRHSLNTMFEEIKEMLNY